MTVTATSVSDTTKSASSPILIAGTIAAATQLIPAASGGTITLPDGSSVTIAPGTLPADLNVSLSKVSYLPNQPLNTAIRSVGPGLVLTFQNPVQFLTHTGLNAMLATRGVPSAHPEPDLSISSAFHFVISTAQNDVSQLVGSVPVADIVGSVSGAADTFIGAVGSGYSAVTHTVTADVEYDVLQAVTVGSVIKSVAVFSINLVAANVQIFTDPSELTLNVNDADPTKDSWTNYSTCPTGKTLLVVHGMATDVQSTFPTSDQTIQSIRLLGGYASMVGFDYNWTQSLDESGTELAGFLNAIAQCPGISIDIEAHSEGVPVSLSALTHVTPSTRPKIHRVIGVAGPIMGTPMANASDLAGYLTSISSISLPGNLASIGIADLLTLPFVQDLQTSTP
ncbi:MAG: hypothetical protein ABI158_10170, partial [Edaphobacter sp.]